MKTLPILPTLRLWLTVLGLLLWAGASPCFALRSIGIVSKEQAKELGMVVRMEGTGAQVWVELEFKAEGELKNFEQVELEIRDGEKLLLGYAALREKRSADGKIVVRFRAERVYVDQITLTVVVGLDLGLEVRVKDFVEAKKGR